MRFEIILAPQAIEDLRAIRSDFRQGVREAIELHLRHEPTKESRSRIKRLRGLDRPQYRLRVNEIRVFYDVTEATVEVLAIVTKRQAEAWLAEEGVRAAPSSAGEDEGWLLAVSEAGRWRGDRNHQAWPARRCADRGPEETLRCRRDIGSCLGSMPS